MAGEVGPVRGAARGLERPHRRHLPLPAGGVVTEPLALIVPVFDEERRVAEFAGVLVDHAATLPAGSELVFVDDGSTDRTIELLEAVIAGAPEGIDVRVLRRPHLGKGA